MTFLSTIDEARLREAQRKIADDMRHQCLNGAQSQGLPDNRKACGQFYGANAINRQQRGVHGTVAAIDVLLNDGRDESRNTAQQLIGYLAHQGDYDTSEVQVLHIRDGGQNTVKQSEILRTLAPHAALSDDALNLAQQAQRTVTEATINGQTWPAFAGDQSSSDIATAFAIWALGVTSNPPNLDLSVQYLWRQYKNLLNPPQSKTPDARASRILYLYSIAFRRGGLAELEERERLELIQNVMKEWNIASSDIDSDTEQNIEYYRGAENYYLRIPWQLYLLSLVAVAKPQEIYKRRFQGKLGSIIGAVMDGGFHYGSAGPELSTRTNAILYHTLGIIRAEMIRASRSIDTLLSDLTREINNKPTVKGFWILFWLVIGFAVAVKYRDQFSAYGPLASELVGAAWGIILTILVKRLIPSIL